MNQSDTPVSPDFQGLHRGPRPEIVCLIGSTRFHKAFKQIEAEFGAARIIVLTVSRFGHVDGLDMQGDTKDLLDELHMWKIDLADRVFVVNPFGYIGESTRREVAYAELIGKPVDYLHEWVPDLTWTQVLQDRGHSGDPGEPCLRCGDLGGCDMMLSEDDL